MSHFIRAKDAHVARCFGKPWAAVEVKRTKKTLVICKVVIANSDVRWAEVPATFSVVDASGAVVQPSRGRMFYVSVETFDPWHLVTEFEK